MMYFLVLNITDNIGHMAFGIRECTIAFLPCKRTCTKILILYPFTAFCFYILYQRGYGLGWTHAC